ncbi:hypothetical protein WV31_09610 [Magnetospirillum sp. ME-1]|uniref:PLP-dependent transferase n=1 Tax=Magnetospirillum sp. ME-1 TaxID=1639348 RepID=UPI000A17D086|nr:hypothetical protein WV31_09610 [Magnetospirillum sp. ME-1]
MQSGGGGEGGARGGHQDEGVRLLSHSDEQRIAAGAGPDVIRLSVGLESVQDLIRDLDQALSAAEG